MTDFAGLVSGYHRFRLGDWQRQRERWSELAEGQSPGTMVIACSDSRVDPTQIFDVAPGEMFVVRNIAQSRAAVRARRRASRRLGGAGSSR